MARSRNLPALLAAGLLALAGCSVETAPLTPLAWQKVPGPATGGAVLDLGAEGAFDERGNFTVAALEHDGQIWLYYGGADATGDAACPGINDAHWRPGLATSTDGVTFTRVAGDGPGGALLDVGEPGSFDSFLTYRPFVLQDGATWRMWFNGSASPFNCPTGTLALDRRVGYADSADGVHWTKHYDGDGPGGSVLPLGAAGEFDAQQIGYVWVIKDGDQYRMYYSANDVTNSWRVGLAVSTDARTWTKVPGKTVTGAVLDLGAAGSFDAACAYQPTVVKERDGLYRMWYRACATPGPFGGPSKGTIGYAESDDGITWIKLPQPGPAGAAIGPGDAGTFDSGGLTTPSALLDADGWRLYYAGFDTTGRFSAGLARAPR
ncbi:MAG: hypothetical protein QM767_24730 [Anaeromyxobacter sp.]